MSEQHDAGKLSSVFSRINKGRLTLTLGISSVVFTLAIICFSIILNIRPSDSVFVQILRIIFILAPITGLIALVMGYRQLKKIRTGVVDRSQRTATRVGVILGISVVSAYFLFLGVIFGQVFFGAHGDSQTPKDAIINDLNNIAAHAYQFKIRAASMGGGQGSYIGFQDFFYSYEWSSNNGRIYHMYDNENATYTVHVFNKDSVEVIGLSKEKKSSSIRVIIDKEGKLGSWSYTGEFE